MRYLILTLFLPIFFLGNLTFAEDNRVSVSLQDYLTLISSDNPKPVGYSYGKSQVTINVQENNQRLIAKIDQRVEIKVHQDQLTAVPLLPVGTHLTNALLNGSAIELQNNKGSLVWVSNKAGKYNLQLNYRVTPNSATGGFTTVFPVAPSTSIDLNGSIPGTGLDLAILPDTNPSIRESGSSTSVSASLPATRAIQLSWRTPTDLDYSISRALYSGELVDDSVVWTGNFQVDNFTNRALELPLLPDQVTLRNVSINNKSASILHKNGYFATMLPGKGKHSVAVEFQVNVTRQNGPPKIYLPMKAVPVSSIKLTLPGKKEVVATPGNKAFHEYKKDETVATLNLPLTSSVSLSWRDALPEDIKAELRANSEVYQSIFASEGVLSAKALVQYQVTRGETNLIEFFLPNNVQINQIVSTQGGIADWRVKEENKMQRASIFLDRKIEENFTFEVNFDRSIGKDAKEINLPFLTVDNVHRSRGMMALLATKELILEPKTEDSITQVGENQLPSFFHDKLEHKVSHTFKYVNTSPSLSAMPKEPVKEQGKFNAQVNTLFSIYDVTLRGSATVELNVKSGSINELELTMPKGVNLLSLTGPSLRNHEVVQADDHQKIPVSFTQDMDGQLRLELSYETLMEDKLDSMLVPTLAVTGAEVEQGRIAVEAHSAVEVSAAVKKELTNLDPSELPKQLILKTTNPILLAYKYVHRDPPFELKLNITKHKEIAVQDAVIDTAHYKTLYTKDGLAVTEASFQVKNSRKQFLKIKLPQGSKVWSVFVNREAVKPALAKDSTEESPEVLVKIINDTKGFPVVLVYQMPVPEVKALGKIQGRLPRPDMVVTNTTWDIYVPNDLSYGRIDSDMEQKISGKVFLGEQLARSYKNNAGNLPVQHMIPTQGKHYQFQKLYANESADSGEFSIAYTSGAGAYISWIFSIVATIIFWIGLLQIIRSRSTSQNSLIFLGIGAVLLIFMMTYFSVSMQLPVILSGIIIVLEIIMQFKARRASS